jgi:ketosteroid isomerase-like protein
MKSLTLLSLFAFIFSSCKENIDHEKAEQYITESEKQWAEATASGDTNVIKRILADDFIGVDTDGNQYDKATMVKETVKAPQYILSNHLNDIKIRFYDNFAIAQGDETFVRRSDSTSARFVWTDTWIYRNNKWEILAAQDIIAPVRK